MYQIHDQFRVRIDYDLAVDIARKLAELEKDVDLPPGARRLMNRMSELIATMRGGLKYLNESPDPSDQKSRRFIESINGVLLDDLELPAQKIIEAVHRSPPTGEIAGKFKPLLILLNKIEGFSEIIPAELVEDRLSSTPFQELVVPGSVAGAIDRSSPDLVILKRFDHSDWLAEFNTPRKVLALIVSNYQPSDQELEVGREYTTELLRGGERLNIEKPPAENGFGATQESLLNQSELPLAELAVVLFELSKKGLIRAVENEETEYVPSREVVKALERGRIKVVGLD